MSIYQSRINGGQATLILSKDKKGVFKYSLTNMSGTLIDHLYRQHQRYWIEHSFKGSKSNLGMADYQVRGWGGWYHHMALICLAQFFILRQEMLFAQPLPLLCGRIFCPAGSKASRMFSKLCWKGIKNASEILSLPTSWNRFLFLKIFTKRQFWIRKYSSYHP